MNLYDPIERAVDVRRIVASDDSRKYYRVSRPGKWYGGIATADCCGCNLRCVFCWSDKPRDDPYNIGKFYSPEEVFYRLIECAKKHGYRFLRVSGNEPTISKKHLLRLIKLVEKTDFLFILETNGTLIDKDFARDLSSFSRLHLRMSLKGTNSEEFSRITGASPDSFEYIVDNIKNTVEHRLSLNIAVMLSFSPRNNFDKLRVRLRKIDPSLDSNLEEEYVFLYPHVIKRLKKSHITPITAYSPKGIPQRLT